MEKKYSNMADTNKTIIRNLKLTTNTKLINTDAFVYIFDTLK